MNDTATTENFQNREDRLKEDQDDTRTDQVQLSDTSSKNSLVTEEDCLPSTNTSIHDTNGAHTSPNLHLPGNVIEHILTDTSVFSPYELALASMISRDWRLAALHAPWRTFYAQRWPITDHAEQSICENDSMTTSSTWHHLFSSRMKLSKSFRGRPQIDRLAGHQSGVKAAYIVPDSSSLLTGSVDRRLSLWDLDTGTQISTSLQHAGTVRSIAMDNEILVTGSTDHRIRVWKHSEQKSHGGFQFPFRVEGPRTVLGGGHSGPVTCLQLNKSCLFSGSWDYTVRVWFRTNREIENTPAGSFSRGRTVGSDDEDNGMNDSNTWPFLKCIQVLHFDDMVMDMSLKHTKLFVASGFEATVVDCGSSRGGLRKLASFNKHGTSSLVTGVQGSEDERYLFYSTGIGGIYACDVRSGTRSSQQPTQNSSGFSCSSAVTSISWDYPWLSASLQNGEILLLNAELTLLSGLTSQSTIAACKSWPPSRVLSAGVGSGAQCVHLSERWLVSGFENGCVVSWDFSKAEEAERATQLAKIERKRARERRKAAARARQTEQQRRSSANAVRAASMHLEFNEEGEEEVENGVVVVDD